jgi:hypothetical protein
MRFMLRAAWPLLLSVTALHGATLVTVPFSPTIVTFPANDGSLPFTDTFGNTLTGNGTISNNPGQIFMFSGPLTVTFANPATIFGFSVGFSGGTPGPSVASVSFSNGDAFSTVTPLTAGSFFGLSSATTFTSVTLNFTGSGSPNFTDFRFDASAVPEPNTILPVALACLAIGCWQIKRRLL